MTNIEVRRRTTTLWLFQDEDFSSLTQARGAFNDAAETAPLRLGDELNPELVEKAQTFDAKMRAAAEENAVRVTVRALRRKAYRALLAECPPREDNIDDEAAGFDVDKMTDLLLESHDGSSERTIIEPDFASREHLVDWLDDLNEGHTRQIFEAAVEVNEAGSPDPKESVTSRLERLSAVSSMPPSRLG